MEETDILLFFCAVKCRTEDWSKKKGSFNGCLNKKKKLKKNRQQQEQQKANPKNPELHEEQGK